MVSRRTERKPRRCEAPGLFGLYNMKNTTEGCQTAGGVKPLMTFLTIGIWHPIVIKTEYLWGIGELFAQRKRVEKGWFPKKGD